MLITGSADGLGLELARELVADGHEVVLHARNQRRAAQARAIVPGATAAVLGDLASVAQTQALADQVNALGRFDAVVHNAAVGYRERRVLTDDGVEHVFAANVLAPYILTALVQPPKRLIYLSSGLHRQGNPGHLDDLRWERRPWNGMQAYSDSKLFDVMLAFAVARLWPEVLSNAVEPGWIATKMGGQGAPGSLRDGADTQRWLATGEDPATNVSGRLFYRRRAERASAAADDHELQDRLLKVCGEFSGVALPVPAVDDR